MKLKALVFTTVLISGFAFADVSSTAAAPLGDATAASKSALAQSQQDNLVIQIQRRGRGGGGGGGGGNAAGAAAAGAMIGIIGGMIAEEAIRQEESRADAVGYCMSKYRSYDPETQTFVGRDGRRHRCP